MASSDTPDVRGDLTRVMHEHGASYPEYLAKAAPSAPGGRWTAVPDLHDEAAYGRRVIETCWLQPTRGDWLHDADDISDADAADIGDGGFATVRATCGRVIDAVLPGPASRLGALRCPTCCRRSGLPDGTGSPLNDPACRAVLGLDEPEPAPASHQSSADAEAVRSAPAASSGRVKPQRIQLKRTKGWRKPEGAVVVARPTRWGNPFRVGVDGDAAKVVARYRRWLTTRASQPLGSGVDRARILLDLPTLAGRDLACWCPLDSPCHADVLLELANGEG